MTTRRVASRSRRENGGAVPPYREPSTQRSLSRERSFTAPSKKEAVYVCPRFAPSRDGGDVLDFDVNGGELTINHHTETQDGKQDIEKRRYRFAHVFDSDTSEDQIFDQLWDQSKDKITSGYNSTILCYGQTGSGKTHTVSNLLPRLTTACFDWIAEEQSNSEVSFKVELSYLQIYMDNVYDLLAGSNDAKRGEVLNHKGKTLDSLPKGFVDVSSPREILSLVKTGNKWRATNAHALNDHSSRSHTLFFLTMSKNDKKSQVYTQSTLLVVDLAGSERVHKTKTTGDAFEEGRAINKALTTLGRVMEGLSRSDKSIPYRENILTMYLKETLTNSFFALVCCCSSDDNNSDETRCTLKFGSVAKQIQITRKTNDQLKARIQAKERKAVFDQTITDLSNRHQVEKDDIQKKYNTLTADFKQEATHRRKLEQTLNYSESERKELLTSLQTLERDSTYLQSLVSTLQQESKKKDDLLSELSTDAKQKENLMNTEMSTLRETHADLRSKLSEASQQVATTDDLKLTNTNLLTDIAALASAKEVLQANASMLEIRITDANTEVEEQSKARESLEKNIIELQDTLDTKETEASLMLSTQQDLTKQLQQVNDIVEAEQVKVSTLKKDISQREVNSKSLRATLTNLSNELLQKEEELAKSESIANNERSCKKDLQRQVLDHSDAKQEFEQTIRLKELDISRLVASQQNLHNKITNLQHSCDEKVKIEQKLTSLQSDHNRITQQIASQKKIHHENTKILEDHISNMERKQTSLQNQLHQSENLRDEEVTNLQTAYHEITQLIDREKQRYAVESNRLHSHINTLEESQDDLETLVAQLTQGKTESNVKMSELQEQLTSVKRERETEESKYKEHTLYLERVVDNLELEQSNANDRLDELKSRAAEHQLMEKEKHASDVSVLELEISKLQNSLDEAAVNQKQAHQRHELYHSVNNAKIIKLESQASQLEAEKESAEAFNKEIITIHTQKSDHLKSVIKSLEEAQVNSQAQISHFKTAFSETTSQVVKITNEKQSATTELNKTISNLQSDCIQLKEVMATVEEQNNLQLSSLTVENQNINNTVKQYVIEQESLKQTQSKLEKLITKTQEEKETVELSCNRHLEHKKQLLESHNQLKDLYEILLSDYDKTKTDALGIHELYMDLEVELASEGEEKNRLQETTADLHQQLDILNNQKIKTEERVQSLQNMSDHLSTKLQIATTARDTAVGEIDNLNGLLADIKSQYHQQLIYAKEAKLRETNLENVITSCEQNLEAKRVQCQELNDQLLEQTAILETSVVLSPQEKQLLEDEIFISKQELQKSHKAALAMENELTVLLNRHEAAVTLSESQSKKCNQLNAECVSGIHELKLAQASLQTLEKSNRQIKHAHAKLVLRTKEIRANEAEIHKLQTYKVQATRLEQKVSSLTSTNKTLNQKSKANHTETHRLKKEVHYKERELQEMRAKLDRANRMNADLKHLSDAKIQQLEKNVVHLSQTVQGQGRCIAGYEGKIKESEKDGFLLKHMVGKQESHHYQKKGTGLGIGQRFSSSPEQQYIRRQTRPESVSRSVSSFCSGGSQPSPGRSVSSSYFAPPPPSDSHFGFQSNSFGKSITQNFKKPVQSSTRSPSPMSSSKYNVRSSGYGQPVSRSLSPGGMTFGKTSLRNLMNQKSSKRTTSPTSRGFGITSMASISSKQSSGYGRPVVSKSRSISPEIRRPYGWKETFSRESSPVFVSRVPSRARSRSPA